MDLPPVNVPLDDPTADTEWNDILRKHGVLPPRPPSPTSTIHEALIQAQAELHTHRLSPKTLQELEELEGEEDEEFLEMYKRKRMLEMQRERETGRGRGKEGMWGAVVPLDKPGYGREVTEASRWIFGTEDTGAKRGGEFDHDDDEKENVGKESGKKAGGPTVLVNMTTTNDESRLLSSLWRRLAAKYPEIKFCEIKADMAVEGYPDRNCPTILIYQNTEIAKQIVTLRELGGLATRLKDLEKVLVQVGAVEGGDRRLKSSEEEGEDDEEEKEERRRVNTVGRKANVESDDEWD